MSKVPWEFLYLFIYLFTGQLFTRHVLGTGHVCVNKRGVVFGFDVAASHHLRYHLTGLCHHCLQLGLLQ